MSRMTPTEMARQIGGGLLSFPVTHFRRPAPVRRAVLSRALRLDAQHELAGLFAAGGTGEFFSLTPPEVARVVKAAVEETAGKIPVVAGCGYGTAIAVDLARPPTRPGPTACCCCRPI
jgi:5-dehydro-4-deoxyglucarate dehydratase